MNDYYDFYELIMTPNYKWLQIAFSILLVVILIASILILMYSVGLWKVYKKAGKKGWQSVIPIYNIYVGCQICGIDTRWVLITIVISFAAVIIKSLAPISAICNLYFTILYSVSMARSFNKDDSFAIGLILLGPIFYFLLGLKKNEYIGANPMKDFVFEMINPKEKAKQESNDTAIPASNTTNDSNNNIKRPNYCSNCGSKIIDGTNYCGNCGQKI